MADLPALLTPLNLGCQLTDARLITEGADTRTKKHVKYYEAACANGMGYVVVSTEGEPTAQYQDCLTPAPPGPDGKPSPLVCLLPGNANPKAFVQSLVAKG